MKHKEIERLKEICEKEGFEITHIPTINAFEIIKKDPWDGVEFVEATDTGRIVKVISFDGERFAYHLRLHGREGEIFRFDQSFFKPSTESAYFDQLKKECFERNGPIKHGDKFQADWCDTKPIQTVGGGSFGYSYWKKTDTLLFNGVSIYCRGKWAKRFLEKVEVRTTGSTLYATQIDNKQEIEIRFECSKPINKSKDDIMSFLSTSLKVYLNNE